MNEKQKQKAGDNSQQMQANTIIVNNGIEEKRAREIFIEMFDVARKDLTMEASIIATQRVTEFENDLIPKIMAIDGAVNAFADPGFQLLLTSAHRTAAVSERPLDYSILSELLIHRIEKGSNIKTRAGIKQAIQIIDEVSDDALLGLTIAYAVETFTPRSNKINDGLNLLDNLFGNLCYDLLPQNREWLEHLDILDAVRLSNLGSLKKFEDFYAERIDGYCAIGIKRDSEKHNKILDLFVKNSLPKDLLIEHEFNKDFVRLTVANERDINDIHLVVKINGLDDLHPIRIPISEKQKLILHEVYEMYEHDEGLLKENKRKLTDELAKRTYLGRVREWWNNIPSSFEITVIGKVLAHANAKRCDKTLPSIDSLKK